MDLLPQLSANLAQIRSQIATAAIRSGRRADDVRLVGVTKYVDVEITRAIFEVGLHDLAESRPQALWKKSEALTDLPVRWHLIGNLQRNKVERTLPLVSLLHSGDSLRLLEAMSTAAVKQVRVTETLLEVNMSGDETKHGFCPDELPPLIVRISQLPGLKILGLMTMASLDGGSARARRDFAALRQLRDGLKCECPPQVELKELSMGMSGDFVEAIEEGATLVRVGSALFEGLE